MMSKQVGKLFGVFVLILIATALIPTIFTNIDGLDPMVDGTPQWLITALVVVVGAGVLFLIWRAVE